MLVKGRMKKEPKAFPCNIRGDDRNLGETLQLSCSHLHLLFEITFSSLENGSTGA